MKRFSNVLLGVQCLCRRTGSKDVGFYNGDGLVPDAENFGLLDAEESRFNLRLIVGLVILVCGGEPTTVDVWVLFLKLKQTQTHQ